MNFTIIEEIDVSDISKTNIKTLSKYGYFEIATYIDDHKYFVDIDAEFNHVLNSSIYKTLCTNIHRLLRERKINCLIDE